MKRVFVLLSALMGAVPLAHALTEVVDGIEWTFTIVEGKAYVGGDGFTLAIPQETAGALTIPDRLGDTPVVGIGDEAFYGCDKITSVRFPETLETIGTRAFASCRSLQGDIYLPEGVSSIGSFAFSECATIEARTKASLVFPASIRDIGSDVIANSGIKSAIWFGTRNTFENLNYYTPFANIDGLSLYSPQDNELDTALDNVAHFYQSQDPSWRSKVSAVSLDTFWTASGDGVRYEERADNGDSWVTMSSGWLIDGKFYMYYRRVDGSDLVIPSSVTLSVYDDNLHSYVDKAFPVIAYVDSGFDDNVETIWVEEGCRTITTPLSTYRQSHSDIRKLHLPASLITPMEIDLSRDCRILEEVDVAPGSKIYYSENNILYSADKTSIVCVAKKGVKGDIVLPDELQNLPSYCFQDCVGLTSIVIPDSVTYIGVCIFSGCTGLTSVTLPKHMQTIPSDMFRNCSSLTSIVLPEGVTTISPYAFEGCENLEYVELPETLVEIGTNAFTNRNCRYVFKGAVPKGIETVPIGWSERIDYPEEHAEAWDNVLKLSRLEVGVVSKPNVRANASMLSPKQMAVSYTVISGLKTAKVRAVAFKDGVRSFANIVPVRTGEGVPMGESVATNEEHSFVWDVASDWSTDLDKVAVEILVQEGTLLPQELITIPATETHQAMTITRNVLAENCLFDALVWCFAEGDVQLTVSDGVVSVDGMEIAREGKLPNAYYWSGQGTDSNWHKKATALLNYLYGKMGYKVLAGEDLEYAEKATRLDFADEGEDYHTSQALRQVSVKIEEGE